MIPDVGSDACAKILGWAIILQILRILYCETISVANCNNADATEGLSQHLRNQEPCTVDFGNMRRVFLSYDILIPLISSTVRVDSLGRIAQSHETRNATNEAVVMIPLHNSQ